MFVAGIEKFLAVSCGAAKVHTQHGVAAIGKELRVSVVAPEVTTPWSAVGEHDRGQVLAKNAFGQREVGRDLEPVG